MNDAAQQAMDSLYAIDNVVTIRITMPTDEWDALRREEPKGGRCNFDWAGGSRYTWRTAASVEISGTHFPPTTTFERVGIKKKSFCGSISDTKPCLHLDFGRDNNPNRPIVDALMGTRYLTLNNSVQDPSYIRQPLGYRLYGLAGLPTSRCNFARVLVNGTLMGDGIAGVNSPGVFVNVEPIMRRYLERNATHQKGNLYEFELHDDFVTDRIDKVAVESLSEFDDKLDLRLAIDHLAHHGIGGAADVVDVDQFISMYAMDFFLKHWDGYSRNTNNTYVYNDVDAVAAPGLGDVNFRMMPWGIDQTLQPGRSFALDRTGLLARLVFDDPTRHAELIDRIATLRRTVFGFDIQESVLMPMIESMRSILASFDVPALTAEIDTVRKQLRLANSAGYLCSGLPGADGAYLRDDATNDVIRAGADSIPPTPVPPAPVPPAPVPPAKVEVVHQPRPRTLDDAALWVISEQGSGKCLTNKKSGRPVHASTTLMTSQGHQMVYLTEPDNADHAEEFRLTPVDLVENATRISHSGYFTVTSLRTGLPLRCGTDPSPSGAPRVHQDTQSSKLFFT